MIQNPAVFRFGMQIACVYYVCLSPVPTWTGSQLGPPRLAGGEKTNHGSPLQDKEELIGRPGQDANVFSKVSGLEGFYPQGKEP